MKLAIIGGKLQGTEVVYLAKKAGYETLLIDKRADAQAAGLADQHVVLDVLKEKKKMLDVCRDVDMIFPAIEDNDILEQIRLSGEQMQLPVIFDWDAYRISSSKTKSNQLFEELHLHMPGRYPECDFPVIVKPDALSGSAGVKKMESQKEVEQLCSRMKQMPVIQEFIEGRSFSLEVIGNGTDYIFPQITEVVVDGVYDCKRIIAPAAVSESERKQLYDMAEKLAKKLKIKGIFDIEVISKNGELHILEIDARFPSQTPISVYHSCGINMVQMLVEMKRGRVPKEVLVKQKICIYQQIVVENGILSVLGEHVMSSCAKLIHHTDFYGADEALVDERSGRDSMRAIVIVTAENEDAARQKMKCCMQRVEQAYNIAVLAG